jgi:hypothetical protein
MKSNFVFLLAAVWNTSVFLRGTIALGAPPTNSECDFSKKWRQSTTESWPEAR